MPSTPTTKTATSPPTSTSPTAVAPKIPAGRFGVRLKPQTEILTAYTLSAPADFETVSGRQVAGRYGDIVVSRGAGVIDVLMPSQFALFYEVVDAMALSLAGGHRSVIERTLGFGATATADHLVTAIERLASLKIGAIDIDFTPSQWIELAHRAEKRGLRVEALVKQIVDKLLQDLWSV